ncbi:hypothetical protein GCM10017690_17430 [Microbacterium terregens]|jgi:hypothetical protein
MLEDGTVDRVVGVGVFGRGVEEGAPAEARALDVVGDGLGDGADDVVGVRTGGSRGVRPDTDRLADLREVGDEQVVLAREVPIERGAGDLCFGDDAIYPDGAEPLGVEEPAGGVEQSCSCLRPLSCSCTAPSPTQVAGAG